MRIDYTKAITGAFVFGILVLIINTIYINLTAINSMFTKEIPIGTILLVIFGIIILNHLKHLFGFYKECVSNKYVIGIILNVCIYLIMLSVVLSIQFELNDMDGVTNLEKQLNNLSSSIQNKQNTTATTISPLEQLKINEQKANALQMNDKNNIQPKNKESNTKQCIDNADNGLNTLKIKSPIRLSYTLEDTKIFDTKNDVINYIKTYSTFPTNHDYPEIYSPFIAARYTIYYPDGLDVFGAIITKQSVVLVCNFKGDIIT